MVDEVKKVKIQCMVNEICKTCRREICGLGYDAEMSGILRLVYDYDSLNDYGKIIVDNVVSCVPRSQGEFANCTKLTNKNTTDNIQKRKLLVKEFVEFCLSNEKRKKYAYYFIFWALMVLTVDDSNKEENLSIICDFVKMFMITDEEVKDIISIIKIVYEQSEYEELSRQYSGEESNSSIRLKRSAALRECIKSQKILDCFAELFNLYLGVTSGLS